VKQKEIISKFFEKSLAHLKNSNDAAASTTRLRMHGRLCWLLHENTEG
jgi:hypothetical protein